MHHPFCETILYWIEVAFNGRIGYGIGSVVFESDMGIRPAHRMLSAKVVRYSTILVFSFGIKIRGSVVAPTLKVESSVHNSTLLI